MKFIIVCLFCVLATAGGRPQEDCFGDECEPNDGCDEGYCDSTDIPTDAETTIDPIDEVETTTVGEDISGGDHLDEEKDIVVGDLSRQALHLTRPFSRPDRRPTPDHGRRQSPELTRPFTRPDRRPTTAQTLPFSRPLGPIPFPRPTGPVSTQRVAFSVRKAVPLQAPATVQFREILTNVGSAWSRRHSRFTAPYKGGYFFTFHAVAHRRTDFTLALMRNGIYQVTAYGSRGDYQHGSNSAFLVLNRGDRVSLQLQEGSIYEHPRREAYTSFNGFMVYRE